MALGYGLQKNEKDTIILSYRIYMDPGGSLPDLLIDIMNKVSVVNVFKDAVTEAQNRYNLIFLIIILYFAIFDFHIFFLVSLLIIGCNNNLDKSELSEMKTVDYVDIERFMGDWYVIANIPTFIEKGATNAIESYKLGDKGVIETTLHFIRTHPMEKKKFIDPKGSYIIQRPTLNGGCNLFGHSKCHF
ncbi:hypothetical protein Ct9H90mP29_08270 [bacterium]|nr:MAG: hypothetical protein Ct9H90mP29_08270 [bacterium]